MAKKTAPASFLSVETTLVPLVFRSVDEVLSVLPSRQDVETIRRDINISFDSSIADAVDRIPSSYVTLINGLRLMAAIRFDSPIPLLNTTNLYDWFVASGISIHVFDSEELSYALPGVAPNRIWVNGRVLRNVPPVWIDPRSGSGMAGVPALFLHEGWHSLGHPHDFGAGQDSSLALGGAWAVQYWYYRWLAEHSGSWLTNSQKEMAASDASRILDTRFSTPQAKLVEEWKG